MATKNQIRKVERLCNEALEMYNKIESSTSKSEKEVLQSQLDKKEEELNRYCISIEITEEEFYNISYLGDVSYDDYMNNY